MYACVHEFIHNYYYGCLFVQLDIASNADHAYSCLYIANHVTADHCMH